MKLSALTLAGLAALGLAYLAWQPATPQHLWPVVDADDEIGLRPVDCWFGDQPAAVECYDMQVPERHDKTGSRIISFPVMVIRKTVHHEERPPLLHLGAGGPGAPMHLEDPQVVEELLQTLSPASLQQGRDLVVIDPRGTGLARPRLTCHEFIEGERQRLAQNLTLLQNRDSAAADDRKCIERFLGEGVDLLGYNSFQVAHDVETLRQAAGIPGWVLLGISYGANYAMTIADIYPDKVESMVLDSASVSRVGYHERYIESSTRPYRLLFTYCKQDPDCSQPIPRVKQRFWDLYEALNRDPILLDFEYAPDMETIPLVVDGERFHDAILQGIYGVQIYRDLPHIITELEARQVDSLDRYLWLHVDYMLDANWGDLSNMAHYCFETKPFTDFAAIRAQIPELPEGFLRDNAELFLDWPDHCAQMRITETAPHQVPSHRLDTPTLFLHGKLDSVTPLSSVRAIQHYFKRARIVTFDLGHSILTGSWCALGSTATFINDPSVGKKRLECPDG